MKVMRILTAAVLIIGMIFKLLHWEGGNILLLLGVGLVVLFAIIYCLRNIRKNFPNSIKHIAIALWAVYLLFRIFYWPAGPMLFGFSALFLFAFGVTLAVFILYASKNTGSRLPQWLFIAYVLVAVTISFVHSYSIFYFFNLSSALNADKETDYLDWERYSWFLYEAGKNDEALQANLKAQQALNDYESRLGNGTNAVYYPYSTTMAPELKRREQMVREKNWNNYSWMETKGE